MSSQLAVTFFLQYSLSIASTFSVGHISSTHLAAISLASMTFNVTSSIFNGMATCLDTLCPAAYGAGKYKMVGLYFQQCILLMLFTDLFIVLFWWNSGIFFRLFVKDDVLVELAQSYLRVMTFCTPAYILFESGKRYLQAQGIFVAGQYALLIASPINILLNYELVWGETFRLGFIGAPVATTISFWLLPLYLLIYALRKGDRRCWPMLDMKQISNEWKTIVGFAFNGIAMLILEFIAFEIITLSSATFGVSTLAAQSICSTLGTLFFQIPFATSVAVSNRISKFIGMKEKSQARTSTRSSYVISLILGLFNFTILVVFRYRIAGLFTNDSEVIYIAQRAICILGINQIFDSPNIIGAGCLRAQARQALGSKLNLICYYIIALPISFYLGFRRNLGIVGLWVGIVSGVFSLSCAEFFFVTRTDWDSVIMKASRRKDVGSNTG